MTSCGIIYNNSSEYDIKIIESVLFKRLLSNNIHKKFKFSFEKENLQNKLQKQIDTQSSLIDVIAMPELDKDQLENYLEFYNDEPDNLNKYSEYLSIITYNQISPNRFQIIKKLNSFLENQSNYWEDPYNCSYNVNRQFTSRRFNNIYFTNNAEAIDKLLNNDENHDYLSDIIRSTDWVDFDIKSYYYISKNTNVSKEDVVLIYKEIPTEYLKYSFLTNLIVTRTHCHLIINNKELLELAKPIIDKYKIIFKYLFGYAWLTFRNEELLLNNKINDNTRIVYDIDTASILPVFPFCLDDINQNPYACVLLDNNLINLKKNCVSMHMCEDYKKYYGVCDSITFKKRLNVFVNGLNSANILDQIDWNHFAISGSAMTACGMKYNPLFDLFKSDAKSTDISDSEFAMYIYHYYNDSDIDLICNHESVYNFLDSTQNLIDKIEVEIKSKVNVEKVHTSCIIISEDMLNEEMDNLKIATSNNSINMEYLKKNLNNEKIKSYMYNKYYIPWKNDSINKNSKDLNTYQMFNSHAKIDDFKVYLLNYETDDSCYKHDYEKCIFMSDIKNNNFLDENNNKVNKLMCKISEGIRFKISSKNMNRSLEVFKTKNNNYYSVISRFHMGCVRAFWNGKTAMCLPSFITSMMLQLSTDYKYFSSIRDPIEIVNKYRSRGFGIILNDHEKSHMAFYNGTKQENYDNKWLSMFNINLESKQSIETLFGPRNINDKLFKPSLFFNGVPEDCFKIINTVQLTTFDTAFADIVEPGLEFISKYTCIDTKGYIFPLQKEVIKLGFNHIFQKITVNLTKVNIKIIKILFIINLFFYYKN